MPNPLIRQLVGSIRREPDRWDRDGRVMRRDDGIEIAMRRQGIRSDSRPKLAKPREVEFGFFEGLFLRRAIRWWLRRRINH